MTSCKPVLKILVLRPNKTISVFPVAGLKILGRVGTHIFLIFFFQEKNIILCILKDISPFKMHNIIFFSISPFKIHKIFFFFQFCLSKCIKLYFFQKI